MEIIRDSLKEIKFVGHSTNQESDQDNISIKKMLKVLGNETLSTTEMMKRLNLSHRPTFRKNYLNPALEQGLIERTIPDKLKSRNQKYRRVLYK